MLDRFVSNLSPYRPHLLSVLRIVTALLFLEHATQKLFHFPAMQIPAGAARRPGGGPPSWFVLVGILEFAGSLLLVAGYWTRTAAFILSGEMAVAYFMAHAPHSFFPILNFGEAAILFCFIYLYIAAAGPGAWALDNHIRGTR